MPPRTSDHFDPYPSSGKKIGNPETGNQKRTVPHTYPGYYFAPPSHWPVVGSLAMFFLATAGAAAERLRIRLVPFAVGFFPSYMLFGWFGTVIRESEGGLFNQQVDMSFRWAMSWFIFSEVMFFAAFFGALFYARVYSLPWLGDIDNKLLWPEFAAHWPSAGPYRPPEFTPWAPGEFRR